MAPKTTRNHTCRKQTLAAGRRTALASDLTPLYAAAGLTDAVATRVLSTLADTQHRATRRLADLRADAETRARVASAGAADLARLATTLPAQVRTMPEQVRELQKQAETLVSTANSAYADLAGRGKRVVDAALSSGRRLPTEAETKADDVADDLLAEVKDAVDPALASAQDAVRDLRKTVTGRTATVKQAPRRPRTSSATSRAAGSKATTASKTTTGSKTTTAKSAPRTAAKRTATKRPSAKKSS